MRGFFRVFLVGAGLTLCGVLAISIAGLAYEWAYAVALAAAFVASFLDREGFWGEPHPFSRRVTSARG